MGVPFPHGDLLAFARMHLEDGRAADGTQVLASQTQFGNDDDEDSPDLGWRLEIMSRYD